MLLIIQNNEDKEKEAEVFKATMTLILCISEIISKYFSKIVCKDR